MTIILTVCLLIFLLFWPKIWRKIKIKRWRNALALDKHLTTFHQLFVDINGFSLSRQERGTQDAIEYLYGEIEFLSFIALLSLTKPNNQTIFYDLGSGVGKSVIACAMVYPVKKSCGIELFSSLHQTALIQQQRLSCLSDYQTKTKAIQFIQGNFLSIDFSEATHIFINATAFIGETWEMLNQQLAATATHAIIITTTKKLSSKVFTVTKVTQVQMSWGIVTAYIQQAEKIPYDNE